MQCPSCNTENPEQARFCLNCGAELTLVCPQCQTELPLHARFCFACGAELGPAQPAVTPSDTIAERLQRLVPKQFAEQLLATRGQVGKERRIVTILFSDVESSTPMAEKLDPEEWTEIMDGAFDVLIEPIYRYEGTLARLMGDAILAFFGAPVAHEDDAERACRAALEIIAGAKRYARHLEEERGIEDFDVRVGINTGLVVVGEVGSDLRVEYTAMGDAINLAKRVESAAEAGTLLIAEDTHKLIAPLFETEALGEMEVKGKTERVCVYRVVAPKALPDRLWGIAGMESPLVGREDEFAALEEAVERLQAGVGGIVTLVGEAGLGKSRLVAELRKKVPPESIQWVEGRCLSYGTSIAYQLWLDMLRGLLGIKVDAAPAQVRDTLRRRVLGLCEERFGDVYPYLARLISLRPEPDEHDETLRDVEGEALKSRTFRAAETLIECAATDRPLALVCEDLHWADPTSIELLERLLGLTDRSPVLFLCVFRPEREHGCWHIKETAARLYAHRHVDLWLDRLSTAESEALLGNLLRMPSLLKTFQERVLSYAEGNPFYVEEIIRSLIDSGIIVRDEVSGNWQATRDLDEMPIPDTLHGVLMARIDRLPEEAKRVLQMAAVIGRIIPYRLLAAIAQEEPGLEQHLLTLQREQMIRERARWPELEYIFKHHLTEEAAYNGLLKKERRALHRRVAQKMEQLFSDRIDRRTGLLAHHWEQAGNADKATEYLLRAGDQARLVYANDEAIDYYQRALEFLGQRGDHARTARTWMKLGLTCHTAFDFRQARQAYEQGFALWQRASAEQPDVAPPPAPHALRVAWNNFATLDPAMAGDNFSAGVIAQLFSGLVELTPEFDIVPDVARSWEVSEGGRRYVFRLRDDVRWSDGKPVTAWDFEYTWKRLLDPATGSPVASVLDDVRGARAFSQGVASDKDSVGVQALDSVNLMVELEEPTGYFLQLMADPAARAVPGHVVEVCGVRWTEVRNIVTNGPFLVQDWHPGQSIVLVRNPHYHGQFRGNLQKVKLSLLEAASTNLEMYEAGGLDVLSIRRLALSEREHAKQRHAEDYVPVPGLSTYYVRFDVSRPPFDDCRVRWALALAADRETMADVTLRGAASPAMGGFVPPGMPGHSPDIGLPYDPERARQLLTEAGYAGGQGFPAVSAMAPPQLVPYAEYLQAGWRDNLGVEIPWRIVDWSMFVRPEQRQSAHLLMVGWSADYPDPDNFLRMRALASFGWSNDAYNALVERARRVTDQAQRMKLYAQADKILVEEAPILPLTYGREHLLVKPWVSKYPTSATSWWFWKDVVIEPH